MLIEVMPGIDIRKDIDFEWREAKVLLLRKSLAKGFSPPFGHGRKTCSYNRERAEGE